MIYIASNACNELINSACKENEEIIERAENSNEFELKKFIDKNVTQLSYIDKFVLDLEACCDLDDEIEQALQDVKILHENIRFIIIAGNRQPGDELLTKIFNMGIHDIICTPDYVEVKQELKLCLNQGKSFKEALIFKTAKKEKIVVKNEIKQVVNKVMIGIAGSQERIGVTNSSIVLANYLRKKGFTVALAEYSAKSMRLLSKQNEILNTNEEKEVEEMYKTDFEKIRILYNEELFESTYFSMNGIDYYPKCDDNLLSQVIGKSYNFIIIDFGSFEECDRITYSKCAERIMISGASAWELAEVNSIFPLASESIKLINFCFNFVHENLHEDVREGMEGAGPVYFLKTMTDPFNGWDFSGADEIFEKYMPVIIEEEKKKKGLFHNFLKSKKGKKNVS